MDHQQFDQADLDCFTLATMVRRRCRTSINSIPSTYYLQGNTAVSFISKRCKNLCYQLQLIEETIEEKKLQLFNQMMEEKRRQYLDIAEIELVLSLPRIRIQIKVMEKLIERLKLANHRRPLSIVVELLQEMEEELTLISEGEESLAQSKPLSDKQLEVGAGKAENLHGIDLLVRIFKDISVFQFPLSRAEFGREVAKYECSPLLHLRELKGLADIYKHRELVEFEVPLLSELGQTRNIIFSDSSNMMMLMPSHERDETAEQWAVEWTEDEDECSGESAEERIVDGDESSGESEVEDFAGNCEIKSADSGCKAIRNLNFSLCMSGTEIEEVTDTDLENLSACKEVRWYLCVNTGYEVFVLDLKQSEYQSFNNAQDAPFIPRIATLDLADQNLPILAGLFKWKSNVYMIGGTCNPSEVLKSRFLFNKTYDDSEDKGLELLESQFRVEKMQGRPYGSSGMIGGPLSYQLSVADDYHSVSYAQSDIFQIEKPKIWPIVEEINGQLHVIESSPQGMWFGNECVWPFSHTVFDCNSGLAEETPTLSDITDCSVLGRRIYAHARGRNNLVFDTDQRRWKVYPKDNGSKTAMDVWSLLAGGPVKCVGTFPCGGSRLDVVVSIQESSGCGAHLKGVYAVACLVNSEGSIVCTQCLNDFYKGPVWPWRKDTATITEADFDDEGKTLCSIVNGDTWAEKCTSNFLFINIFRVELLVNEAVAGMVCEVLSKGREKWPVDMDFVRLHTEHSSIYKTDEELGVGGLHPRYWAGLQACFFA